MESSPPLARYVAQNSKKRVFPGTSSSYMESDVSPPLARSLKLKSPEMKEVICPEVIDVDSDEGCCDIMLIDAIDTPCKGKEAAAICPGSVANFSVGPVTATNIGSMEEVQSSNMNGVPGLHNLTKPDGFDSNLNYGDDEYMDMYYDDLLYDDYTILQSQFDNMEIPPGVEAPIPWMLESALNKKKTATASGPPISLSGIHLGAGFSAGTNLCQSLWLPEPAQIREKSSSKSMSSLQNQMHNVGHSRKMKILPSWSGGGQRKEKSVVLSNSNSSSQAQKAPGNFPSGMEQFKYWNHSEVSHRKWKPVFPHGTIHPSLHNELPSIGGFCVSASGKKQVGNNLTHSSVHLTVDAIDFPSGVGSSKWLDSSVTLKSDPYMIPPVYHGFVDRLDAVHISSDKEAYASWVQYSVKSQEHGTANAGSSTVPTGSSSSGRDSVNVDEIMQKFHLFKNFDTVQDCSDHHYSHSGSSVKKPSKNWAKKIQEEWKILENDLPDSIFVRVYESRMDLLRAVIVGAEGTPYHDGLFFFDVFFPSSYPNVPPLVYYHSGGLRLNPNLYNSGKVCLSLLNTWSGSEKEKWIPGVSTMLQVLVSIQGLILNAKPFFNEPGFANMSGSAVGEQSSLQYNENAFILSLKTMVYTMRRPPKYFEDFVVGHFLKRANDILVACKAYMDGAQVGCLVKGGVQDVDEGDKSSSQTFKHNLAGYIDTLVTTFTQIGVTDCERFLPLTTNMHLPVSAAPKA